MNLTMDRDAPLLEALRLGEPTAAERLVEAYGDRVYRLAIGITGSEQDAEEVVQDVLWNVVRNIDTFRGDATLGSWIYRITANAAYRKRRSCARRRDEISLDDFLLVAHKDGRCADPIVDWSAELGNPAVQTELRSVLTSALHALPDHYRAVTILHDVEGLSLAEVADCLDITESAARSRAHRARLLLRHHLGAFMSGATAGVEMGS